jgi:hypothetical protein
LTWFPAPSGDWFIWLLDVQSGEYLQLKIEPWIFHGKNWVPVVVNDELLIIRSLDPAVILSVGKGGVCSVIHAAGDLRQEIGNYRGGSCDYHAGEAIAGFGHRTHDANCHTIFHYVFNVNNWSLTQQDLEVDGLQGLGIIDPTSAWDDYVGCCATPRGWPRTQFTVHGILRVIAGEETL